MGLKWRALLFAVVTAAVLTAMYLWETSPHPGSNIYPPPNFLGSTWYGPLLLLLIPLSLGWWSWGAKRVSATVIRLLLTLLVLIICIQFILVGIGHVRPLILPWQSG